MEPPLELLDLQRDLVERDFRQLEQHQRLRSQAQQLARQLRADRAAGAGDHHHLAPHIGGQQLQVGDDRIAPQQVLDVDRPEVADLHMARGDLLERRQGLHHHRKSLERPQRDAPLAAQRRRRGEQHLLDVLLGDQLGDLLRPRHFQAVHELAGKRGIGIDEGDGLVAAGLVQRAQQLDAERAGAVDDDRLPLIEARRLVLRRRREQRRARPLPAQANEAGGDQAVDHHRRPRMILDPAHIDEQRPEQGGDDHRGIDAGGAFGPDEPGHQLVQPAHIEDGDADEGGGDQQRPFVQALGHVEPAEPERIGGPQRDAEHRDVVEDQECPLEPARTLDQPYGQTH